ncbi:MAG: HAMP domain-containing sensor histidine kinase [bacterium]|nr:HAMP domain-containing sensor histidine kinase [bacterium]
MITSHYFIALIVLSAILAAYAFYQKKQKDETAKKLGKMVQLDRLKNDFLSVAQHQLRTPLSGVKWALEMLKAESSLPVDSMSLIDAGLERIKDAIGIINQMLKTIEAEGGTLVLNIEKVDIAGMVQSIIAELNFITIKKKIKLSFISPNPSILINADRNKIKAAVINIIDNAIKYSPNGRVDVEITDSQSSVTIVTKDTGIGITPEDLPYIFDRLHRGKNAVMVEPDESGVGLYTSKKMIELHGGKISISSELNKGTAVTVVLPKNL